MQQLVNPLLKLVYHLKQIIERHRQLQKEKVNDWIFQNLLTHSFYENETIFTTHISPILLEFSGKETS